MVLFCLTLTQFCIGLSIGPFTSPQPYMFLQIKNVTGTSMLFERMDWFLEGSTLSSVKNLNVSIGLISDNDLVVRAGEVRILPFSNLPTTHGVYPTSRLETTLGRCVTVMKCLRGQQGFCDPYSDTPIDSEDEITLGQYLKLMPCKEGAVSQRLIQMNHNCTMEKLTNDKCDNPDCNLQVFRNDSMNCHPTTTTTRPSLRPSLGPSPSPSPSPPDEWTLVPSASPTVIETYYEVTVGPTHSPTQEQVHSDRPRVARPVEDNSSGEPGPVYYPLAALCLTLPMAAYVGYLCYHAFLKK